MADHVETQSVARGVAEVPPALIAETATTRTIFEAKIIDGHGIDGALKRQKRDENGGWSDLNGVNFRNADPDTVVSIPLKTSDVRKLYDLLSRLYAVQNKGVLPGSHDYVVAGKDEIIVTNENLAQVIQELIDENHSQKFWDTLVANQADLAMRLAESQIQRNRMRIIEQFEQDMQFYGDNEKHWQDFFGEHPWILQSAFAFTAFQLRGETYVGGKSCVGRNGQGGVATDFLFRDESTQSFAVVDIKNPDTELMAKRPYRGKDGTSGPNVVYPASGHLSGGVIQVRTQISEAIRSFEVVLHNSYPELNRVHPHGVLVAGNYDKLEEEQKRSFNHFRRGLFGLTVITFDELLGRLKQLYTFEEHEPPSAQLNKSSEDNPWAGPDEDSWASSL